MEQHQQQQIDDFTDRVRYFADKYGKDHVEWNARRLLRTGCVLVSLIHKHSTDSIFTTVCNDGQKEYLRTRMAGLDRIDEITEVLADLNEQNL